MELAIPALRSAAQDYSLGLVKNRSPIAHRSGEQASEKQLHQQQELVVKSFDTSNTPTDSQIQTTIHDKIISSEKREGLFSRYILKRITETTTNSILSKSISQSKRITEGNNFASSNLLKSGRGIDGEIAYYEAKEGIAPATSTPVGLSLARMEYKGTALGNVKSIFRQALRGPGAQLVEKLVQNVFKTFIENHLRRYLVAKERLERTLDKNPFFKQAEENGLVQSYINFESELADIRRLGWPQVAGHGWPSVPVAHGRREGTAGHGWPSVPVAHGWREGTAGGRHGGTYTSESINEKLYVLSSIKNPLETGIQEVAGMEYLPALKTPGGSNSWKIADKVLSHITKGKQILEIHKRSYSGILERENEAQLRRKQSILKNIDNHEAVITRQENKQGAVLKLLQNKDHLILSGKISYQNSRASELELAIPALPVKALDYSSGYAKNMPPITYKSNEQVSAKQSQQRELVVKSLNTPTDSQTKTKKSVDMDLNPTQLSNLVDKVYAQLESKLAWERRRYGY